MVRPQMIMSVVDTMEFVISSENVEFAADVRAVVVIRAARVLRVAALRMAVDVLDAVKVNAVALCVNDPPIGSVSPLLTVRLETVALPATRRLLAPGSVVVPIETPPAAESVITNEPLVKNWNGKLA